MVYKMLDIINKQIDDTDYCVVQKGIVYFKNVCERNVDFHEHKSL